MDMINFVSIFFVAYYLGVFFALIFKPVKDNGAKKLR